MPVESAHGRIPSGSSSSSIPGVRLKVGSLAGSRRRVRCRGKCTGGEPFDQLNRNQLFQTSDAIPVPPDHICLRRRHEIPSVRGQKLALDSKLGLRGAMRRGLIATMRRCAPGPIPARRDRPRLTRTLPA